MPNKPVRVGVTGGIGAGKTLVCKLFALLGMPVYNADDRAKVLMESDTQVKESVREYFGKKAYFEDGKLNRKFLANSVFNNSDRLEILNGIVHPVVAMDFEKWASAQKGANYIIKEAALLIESGSAKVLDYIISVTAPEKLRIERTLKRDPQRTLAQVKEIIENQLSDAERKAKSDFFINNDDHVLLIPQVLSIHEFLISSIHIG
jgi:dephospho-CoA kinase